MHKNAKSPLDIPNLWATIIYLLTVCQGTASIITEM